MVKFWTPTKIIVTILMVLALLFILFKLGVFDFMNLDTLFIAGDPTPQAFSGVPSSGGGIK